MTVPSSTNRADYSGNGSTIEFATNFRFLQNEDLKVILTNTTTNVETEQSINSDYTVTGVGLDAGGTVTMVIAPPSGYKLSILRSVAKTQETDYVENDDFPAKSHEDALDKLTMICQEQQDEIDRSLKLSESQIATGLTVPAAEEGKFLQWDDDGNLKNVTISASGELITTSFGEEVIVTSDAKDLRDLIEVYSQDEVYTKQGISDIIPASDYFNGGGSADAYTLSAISPRLAPTSLVDGMKFRAIFDDSNTGACTVNPFGLGAIDIKLKGGATDPSAGYITADEEVTFIYRAAPSAHAELVISAGLGVDQTWQDLTASRPASTNYTNTTGRTITIILAGEGVTVSFTIDGISFTTSQTSGIKTTTVIVPNGSVYSYDGTINKWLELR
jgi:hypothetical protein